MNKISRHNYEEFFIDYFDGNLDNHQVAELMLFLAQNSDLDNEFNQFKHIELDNEEISFNFKDELKKEDSTITGSIFTDKCIDKIEGNLSEQELNDFNNEIKHNIPKKTELNLFEKTILKPNNSVIFPNKSLLKKQTPISAKFKNLYKYAAVLIGLFFVFTLLQENNNTTKTIKNANNIASLMDFSTLSSFDKYDNQNELTILRTETPNIVSKSKSKKTYNTNTSVSINKSLKKQYLSNVEYNQNTQTEESFLNELFNNNNIDYSQKKYSNTEKDVMNKLIALYKYGNTPNNSNNIIKPHILKNQSAINIETTSAKQVKNCNDDKKLASQLGSTKYIAEILEQFKGNNTKTSNSTSVWEVIGSGISTLTGSEIQKTYNKNGKVSRLAINSNRFRVTKKINK